MIRVRCVLVLLACLAVMCAPPASAQHAPELRGRVVDAATSTPLQDAEVLSSDGARAVTGTDGMFVLRALKPGPAQVTVRRVGYAPIVRDVDLVNGNTSSLTVMLTASPVQLAELAAAAAPASGGVTSIDRAAIAQSGASDLGDILQQQGGVVVTRAGGPGSPATASIRGSSANQVLVLVDGVPQNQAVSGSADLSLVRLDNVEKISVVRGAQSARYGQQALGGAIVVETRRPVGVEAQAEVGAGSYGARALSGRASVGRNTARGVAASVSGAYNDFAGDFPYEIPPERGGGTGVRLNSAVRDVSLNGSATWTGATAEARVRGEYFDVDRGMPGTRGAAVAQRSPDPAAVRRGHRRHGEAGPGLRIGERLAAAAGRDLRRQCAAILGTVRRPEPGRCPPGRCRRGARAGPMGIERRGAISANGHQRHRAERGCAWHHAVWRGTGGGARADHRRRLGPRCECGAAGGRQLGDGPVVPVAGDRCAPAARLVERRASVGAGLQSADTGRPVLPGGRAGAAQPAAGTGAGEERVLPLPRGAAGRAGIAQREAWGSTSSRPTSAG